MDYTEIWNIEKQQIEINYFSTPIIVGSLFILFECIVLLSRHKWGENSKLFKTLNSVSRPKYPYSIIFFPIGILLFFIGFFMIKNKENNLIEIKNEIRYSKTEIVEGDVIVKFKQPKEGHTDGDIIQIENKTFEISTFFMSDYYHKAISNGGILKEGKNVRISFIPTKKFEKSQFGNGKIIKIEEINK